LTIYESVFEGENFPTGDAGKAMQIDGEKRNKQLTGEPIRFRELPYSVETGEAEMISVDFVARGGGNAMAVEGTDKPKLGGIQQENGKKQTNMAKQSSREGGETEAETSALSREDEDGKYLGGSLQI
jgi:COP9 signalosome complex subunit 6